MAKDMIDEIRRAEKESGEEVEAARQAAKKRIGKARDDAQAAIKIANEDALSAEEAYMAETKSRCSRIGEQAAADAEKACKALSARAGSNREITIQKLLDTLF